MKNDDTDTEFTREVKVSERKKQSTNNRSNHSNNSSNDSNNNNNNNNNNQREKRRRDEIEDNSDIDSNNNRTVRVRPNVDDFKYSVNYGSRRQDDNAAAIAYAERQRYEADIEYQLRREYNIPPPLNRARADLYVPYENDAYMNNNNNNNNGMCLSNS